MENVQRERKLRDFCFNSVHAFKIIIILIFLLMEILIREFKVYLSNEKYFLVYFLENRYKISEFISLILEIYIESVTRISKDVEIIHVILFIVS